MLLRNLAGSGAPGNASRNSGRILLRALLPGVPIVRRPVRSVPKAVAQDWVGDVGYTSAPLGGDPVPQGLLLWRFWRCSPVTLGGLDFVNDLVSALRR